MKAATLREELGRWWAEEFPSDVLPTEALIRLSERRTIVARSDWQTALWTALFAVGLLALFALLYVLEPAA